MPLNRRSTGLLIVASLLAAIWVATRAEQPGLPAERALPPVPVGAAADGAQAAAPALQVPPAIAVDAAAARTIEPRRRLHDIFTRLPEVAVLEVQPPQGPDGRCNGCLCTLKPPTYVWLHYWLDQLKTNRRGDDAMQVLEKYVLYREHCIGRGWTSLPSGESGDYMYGWNGHVYAVRKADYPLHDRYENLRMDPDFDQKAPMDEEKVREVSCYIEEGLKDLPVRVDI